MAKNKKIWKVPVTITHEQVFSLLVSALEGGSNYWYAEVSPLKRTSKARSSCDRLYNDFIANGFEICDVNENTGKMKKYKVWPEDLEDALQAMAEGNPHFRHFEALIGDNADVETGDVFLQLCVFGEVKYG